jgi:hypothetical protein
MREKSHQIWMCDQDTNPCLKDGDSSVQTFYLTIMWEWSMLL